MTSHPRPQISIRLDPDLAAKLERAAVSERRTVSNWLRNLIADHFAGRAGADDQSRRVA